MVTRGNIFGGTTQTARKVKTRESSRGREASADRAIGSLLWDGGFLKTEPTRLSYRLGTLEVLVCR
jgi:hypothetical protein